MRTLWIYRGDSGYALIFLRTRVTLALSAGNAEETTDLMTIDKAIKEHFQITNVGAVHAK